MSLKFPVKKYYRWLLGIIAISILGFIVSWQRFLITPIMPPKTHLDYIFPSGASVRTLANDLHALGLLPHPYYFIALAYVKNAADHLHAGEYYFEANILPTRLLQKMVEGEVFDRKITFVEGITFAQIMALLNNNPLIEHRLLGLPRTLIAMKLGLSGVTNPEGLFFPSTYQYTAGMSDQQILLLAYHHMQNLLQQQWQQRDKTVPYDSAYQALIVASIIEKEAEISPDRPKIAQVIINRLAKGMRLQMDSTVIYALGKAYHFPLTRQNLTVISPYNTYLYSGLPPTPIASPGLASLHAALHPTPSDDYYFVARGNGSHQFSVTYAQQQLAIAKYLKPLS